MFTSSRGGSNFKCNRSGFLYCIFPLDTSVESSSGMVLVIAILALMVLNSPSAFSIARRTSSSVLRFACSLAKRSPVNEKNN